MTAIVTDVKYRMSPAIIRELAEAGVRVAACHREEPGGPPPLGFYSRHTAERHTLPAEGYLDALYALCGAVFARDGRRPALLPVGASTLALLAAPEARARFRAVCGLCVPTAAQLSLLNDKGRAAELAAALGIPVPRSFTRAEREPPDAFFARVTLPCVVKPRWGEGLGLPAARRYRIARTRPELIESYSHFSALAGEPPLVLEYLPGAATACSLLAQRGSAVRLICHRRVREYPITGGPSTCCAAFRDAHMEQAAARMASACGLSGPAMFEFKGGMDGTPRLLEVNPRIWGSYPLTRAAKAGFSYAWFALSWNEGNPDAPLPCPPPPDCAPRRMRFFPSDLAAARDYLRAGEGARARGAALDLLRPGVRDGLFEWNDPRPALVYWRALLKRSGSPEPAPAKIPAPAEAPAPPETEKTEKTEETPLELRIDLHVHTSLSHDGRSAPEALAMAAAARGLDAIVLCDHDACALDKPAQMHGVWLLPGCECSTDQGHILGLFLERPPDFQSMRGADGRISARLAVDELRRCGAVTVLAHPFLRAGARADAPVDCIEGVNARVFFKNPRANEQASALAAARGLPATGGSDAHAAGEVGNAYTVMDATDCSLPALRAALLDGRCRPVLVKNTRRLGKGLSQFHQAWHSRRPRRILKGFAYLCYCLLGDIWKGDKA